MSQEMYAGPAPELTEKQAAAKEKLLLAGDEAFDAENFERALDCYHRASLIDGSDPRIWNSLGITYSNLEFNREAWRSYKLSLHCDPDNLETLWYAGEFLYNVDDLPLALALLTRYKTMETDSERLEEADELIGEIREVLGSQQQEIDPFGEPPRQSVEDEPDEEDEFEGFEVEGEGPGPEEDYDEFGDDFLEEEEELELEGGDEFVANLSLQLTTMDSKCTSCMIMIPADAPYCYSCKAPHFYE